MQWTISLSLAIDQALSPEPIFSLILRPWHVAFPSKIVLITYFTNMYSIVNIVAEGRDRSAIIGYIDVDYKYCTQYL